MEGVSVVREVSTIIRRARDGARCVVAIPVRNEAKRIGTCLDALARQAGPGLPSIEVIVVLNACVDETWSVVRRWMCQNALPLRMIEVNLAPEDDHAGGAREASLKIALQSLDDPTNSLILTTDGDSRVPQDWVSLAVACVHAGCDVVAGEIVIDEAEFRRLSPSLQRRCRMEDTYASLLARVDSHCDPQRHDLWPCHRRRSGANLAFRASALAALPFLPKPACGEDRALVDACLARDLRVRHEPALRVTTSARLSGRAPGGMADTLRYRKDHLQAPCDPGLEALESAVTRSTLRAAARRAFRPGMSARALAEAIGFEQGLHDMPCAYFGEAWRALEHACAPLHRVSLHPSELSRQIRMARRWLMQAPAFSEEVAA